MPIKSINDMISQKLVTEYCLLNRKFTSLSVDLLLKINPSRLFVTGIILLFTSMDENLNAAIKAMSLEEDEPITLPYDPRFKVFDENSISLLGRLLNPDCQLMARMIEDMSHVWRVYDKVRGIALSRDKFQFIFQRKEDLLTVLNDRPWSYNHWKMLLEQWTPSPSADIYL